MAGGQAKRQATSQHTRFLNAQLLNRLTKGQQRGARGRGSKSCGAEDMASFLLVLATSHVHISQREALFLSFSVGFSRIDPQNEQKSTGNWKATTKRNTSCHPSPFGGVPSPKIPPNPPLVTVFRTLKAGQKRQAEEEQPSRMTQHFVVMQEPRANYFHWNPVPTKKKGNKEEYKRTTRNWSNSSMSIDSEK